MAVNETRSLTYDLREGLSDGSVKKINPDRGGQPNDKYSALAQQTWRNQQYGSVTSSMAADEVADRYTNLKG